MKTQTSVILAGGLALALWGGLSGRDRLAQAKTDQIDTRPQAVVSPPRNTPTPAPDDARRRAELNARLSAMIADDKGGRLADAPARPPRARPVRTVAQTASRPAAAQPASTIAAPPPPHDPGRARPAALRARYTPPRLDLTTPPAVPADPVACLTQAIYYEARNESEDGQAAVAEVVMNRAGSGRYPRDVCQVVYQRNTRTCQFTFTCDGSIGRSPINPAAWARAERIARGVYAGQARTLLPRHSVNYHADYVRPRWSSQLDRVRRIGAHIFYGAPAKGAVTPGAEPSPPPRGLMFVKNDALERAYAMLARAPDADTPTD